MYENSYDQLTKAGYISIGMDHYSKPDDEFSIALNEKNYIETFKVIVQGRPLGKCMVLVHQPYLN